MCKPKLIINISIYREKSCIPCNNTVEQFCFMFVLFFFECVYLVRGSEYIVLKKNEDDLNLHFKILIWIEIQLKSQSNNSLTKDNFKVYLNIDYMYLNICLVWMISVLYVFELFKTIKNLINLTNQWIWLCLLVTIRFFMNIYTLSIYLCTHFIQGFT